MVLKKNDIGTTPEQTMKAIELMNEIGGVTENGIYKLLPGINLLYGLVGESDKTYELNYQFLRDVLDKNLLLRRINLRQVREIAGYRGVKVNRKKFKNHKDLVNREINKPMLQRVFPKGAVLTNVKPEKQEGNVTYGRQLGTYPILVGIAGEHSLNKFLDVKVIDHGYRSITALVYPFNINRAQLAELTFLPGIGKKRASHLFVNKPIDGLVELRKLLDDMSELEQLESLIDKY